MDQGDHAMGNGKLDIGGLFSLIFSCAQSTLSSGKTDWKAVQFPNDKNQPTSWNGGQQKQQKHYIPPCLGLIHYAWKIGALNGQWFHT